MIVKSSMAVSNENMVCAYSLNDKDPCQFNELISSLAFDAYLPTNNKLYDASCSTSDGADRTDTEVESLSTSNRKHLTITSGVVVLIDQAVQLMKASEYSTSLDLSEHLLEYVWEQLNTGHWKNVGEYILASCLLVGVPDQDHVSVLSGPVTTARSGSPITKTCDKGLIMGAPVFDNILVKVATKLHAYLITIAPCHLHVPETSANGNQTPPSKIAKFDESIDTKECPDMIEFLTDYVTSRKPVKITGAAAHWPAVQKWSVPYIMQMAGHRLVPIEIGSSYTDGDWSQTLITVAQFVDKYIMPDASQAHAIGYLAQHELFEQIECLKDDVLVPDYCLVYDEDDDDIQVNAWFGPSGTVSPLHQDPRDNVFVQVFGSKLVTLVDPIHTKGVYPNTEGMLTNTSQVDIERPDLASFPDFENVRLHRVHVNAGDMLYMPKGWWHQVRSTQPSFSVSYWFGPTNKPE